MASITVGFSPSKPPIFSALSVLNKHYPTTLLCKSPISSSSFPSNRITASFTSYSSSSSSLSSSTWKPSSATAESVEPEPASAEYDPGLESPQLEETDEAQEPKTQQAQTAEAVQIPKGADAFAVVMVGSRQYIVIPGRTLVTQRLKGANVNDKIILNKVLLVGTKTHTYIGRPVVPNAAVHAVVEEQGKNKKVIVFKFKKKKNYRRTIGHRQPNTRLRITGITGYEDSPVGVPNVTAA